MSTEAWTFLVSRNRYLDYRTVVAPNFISGTTTFLARAVGGDLSKKGQANYREIHNSKDGDITLIFRVIEATGGDIGEGEIETLKDSFGRAISLIEGIAIKGKHPYILVNQEIFDHVHMEAIAHYRTFWNQVTPEAALISQSFVLPTVEQEDYLHLIQLEPLSLEVTSTKATNQSEIWRCTRKLHTSDEISSLVYSVNGEILVVTKSSRLQVWLEKKEADYSPDLKFARSKFVIPSSDGEEFAICYVSLAIPPTQDFIVLWNRKTNRRLKFHDNERKWVDKITSVAISPDKQLFATCDEDGSIRIWDIPSKLKLDLSLTYASCIRSSTFSPDGQFLASGYHDGTIKLWKPKTGRESHSTNLHKGSVRAITFSPDGQFLASGDSQGKIIIWNVETLTELKKLDSAHTLPVNAIAFGPNGSAIASGSDDGFVKLWAVKTGANLFASSEGERAVNAVAFGGHNGMLISGGDDGYVRIWSNATAA